MTKLHSILINTLSLVHYKNYSGETISFSPGLNLVLGQNGMGKTNLLDAVHYLCMAKSHSTPLDKDTVQFGQPFFRLEATAHRNGSAHEMCVKVKPGEMKDISLDGKSVDRLSTFIGFMPVIMLSPEDIILIQGGSTARRRFMDVALCQTDKEYLENLQRYNKFLAQRNALLRNDGYRADRMLLMTYTTSMQEPAKLIHERRAALASALIPEVIACYLQLSEERETPALKYISHLELSTLEELAKASIEADLQNARTTKGIHRDDLDILLDGYTLKRFGSQGQIKSLMIAMHLAQARYIQSQTGLAPILLLDDIFDRLDEERSRQLIDMLVSEKAHQVFISDASPERVFRLVKDINDEVKVFEIEQGKVHRSYLLNS